MSIDAVKLSSLTIGSGFAPKGKSKKEEVKEEKAQVSPETKSSVPADKVLDYMAANSAIAASSVKGRTVDTAKYVDEASAARIGAFMASFEAKVAEGLAEIDKEFGSSVSDSAKLTMAAAKVSKEMN